MKANATAATWRARGATAFPSLVDLSCVLTQAAIFAPLGAFRLVDGDEGYYAVAARLVGEGRLPYEDFAYGQMPLLPYVYAAALAVPVDPWYATRFFSVLLSMATGAILYAHVARRYGDRRLGMLALTLFASSSIVFIWFTALKTYALSTFLLVGAFALAADARYTGRRALAVGVLLGLAIDTRLLFAAAVPAFAVAAWRRGYLKAVGGGLAIGLAPAVFFLVRDPGRFMYLNLGIEGDRTSAGLIGDLGQKVQTAGRLIGIGAPPTERELTLQFLLLVVAAMGALVVARRDRVGFPLALAALLAIASLLPTPTQLPYFCILVPFLVLGVVGLVAEAPARLRSAVARRVGLGALAAALIVYVAAGAVDVRRWGPGAAGADDFRLDRVREMTALIDESTQPGERVLTAWPGYLVGSHAVPVPGLENDFAPHAAASLSPAEARRYHLATIAEVERLIHTGSTRLVVPKVWGAIDQPTVDWEEAVARGPYRLQARVGSAGLYQRESS